MTIDDFIAPSTISGWDIAFALLTLLATWVVFRIVRKVTTAGLAKVGGLSENMRQVIVRVVKYLILLTGVGIALTFLGAQLTPVIIAVVIVAGVVLLGLRGLATNFGAGVVLQTRKPITLGQEIESQGYTGTVVELNGRSVLVRIADGRIVHLPNDTLLQEPLINRSEYGTRRSEVEIRLENRTDVAVADTLLAVVARVDGVLTEPAPDLVVLTVDPHRVTTRVRFWHAPLVYVQVTSDVVAAVGTDLRDRGIPATVTSDLPDSPLTPPAPI